MRFNKIIITSVFACVLSSNLIAKQNRVFYSTSADTNVTLIGRFADIEPVIRRQKIYINPADITFIESTGRIVYSEPHSEIPDLPIGTLSITPPVLPRDFYYYADRDNPKITQIHNIYNDLDSLIVKSYYDNLVTNTNRFNTFISNVENRYMNSLNYQYITFNDIAASFLKCNYDFYNDEYIFNSSLSNPILHDLMNEFPDINNDQQKSCCELYVRLFVEYILQYE